MVSFIPAGERAARLEPAERRLHHAILRAFPTFGGPPRPEWPATRAVALGLDPGPALATLVEADVIQMDSSTGAIAAAYPFSGVETAHRVAVAGGTPVFAMCAIDALGIPFMLGADAVVTSVDPRTFEAIAIEVRDGAATWRPESACMLVGTAGDCGTTAERLCRTVNFFASPASAAAYADAHAALTAEVLDQEAAVRSGIRSFGALLAGEDGQACREACCAG